MVWVMPEFLNSSSGVRLTIREVIGEIADFMAADPKRRYQVTIGTDSELLSDKTADFVSAVVVRRVGNGARYFWRRFTLGKFHTLRDRMVREALISIELAQGILGELRKASLPEYGFEIHADIGEQGPTRAVIQEVVGMIRANNFEVQIKPYSYAATNVADRHV